MFVGEAFVGEPVELVEAASGDTLVRFAGVDLVEIHRRTGAVRRCGPPRPPAAATHPHTQLHRPAEPSPILPV